MICIIQKTVKIQSFRSLQTGSQNPIISNQLKRMVENSAGGGIQSSVQCTTRTWYAVRKVEEAPAAVSARVPTNKARIYSIWLIWCGLRQKRRSWFYRAFIVGLYFIKKSGDSYWANEAHLMKRRKGDAVLSFQSRVRMNLISRFFSYSFLFPVPLRSFFICFCFSFLSDWKSCLTQKMLRFHAPESIFRWLISAVFVLLTQLTLVSAHRFFSTLSIQAQLSISGLWFPSRFVDSVVVTYFR